MSTAYDSSWQQLEWAAQCRIRAACADAGVGVEELRPRPSVTDFVFEGRIEGQEVVAKCSFGGMSRHTAARQWLASGQHLDDWAVLHTGVQFGGAQNPDAIGMKILSPVLATTGVRVPKLLFAEGNVVVMERVTHARALGEISDAEKAEVLCGRLWTALGAIWSSTLHHAPPEVNGAYSRSILAVFERKVGGGVRDYVGLLINDRAASEALSALGAMLQLAPVTTAVAPALVVGDLKPEHVLVDQEDSLVLIDNAVHINQPGQDIAKFLLRAALFGQDLIVGFASTWRRFATDRQVNILMAMDWFNIVTTWAYRSNCPHPQLPVYQVTMRLMDALVGEVQPETVASELAALARTKAA